MKELFERKDNFPSLAKNQAFGKINVILFQLDAEGKLLFINRYWEIVMGYSLEQTIGKNIFEFIAEDSLAGISSSTLSRTAGGTIAVRTKHGETRRFDISLTPLFSSGKLSGYYGTMFDISVHMKKMEEVTSRLSSSESRNREMGAEIARLTDESRQKDLILIQQSRLAAMGEMAASFGQLWRKPLNSLSLLLEDVREALEFGEMDSQSIDGFIREGRSHINQLCGSLQDFRRFYRLHKEKTAFSIAEAIEDALMLFSAILAKHEITVDFIYRGQAAAFGYPNEFSQAVLNILANARDAFVSNEVEKRKMIISLSDAEGYAMAEFVDTAGGIDPTIQERVFDPYFTTKQNGTGLGLYMAKMILENMGGGISCENVNSGARFRIFVPKAARCVPEETEPFHNRAIQKEIRISK